MRQRHPANGQGMNHSSGRDSRHILILYIKQSAGANTNTCVGSVRNSYGNAVDELITGLFKNKITNSMESCKSSYHPEVEGFKFVNCCNIIHLHRTVGYNFPKEAEETLYSSIEVGQIAAQPMIKIPPGKPGAVHVA